METAQEFMERFLRKKAEAQKITAAHYISLFESFHTKEFLERFLRKQTDRENNLEKLEKVEEHEGSVTAFTSELYPTLNFLCRYHLLLHNATWRITRTDYACIFCKGTGKMPNSTEC